MSAHSDHNHTINWSLACGELTPAEAVAHPFTEHVPCDAFLFGLDWEAMATAYPDCELCQDAWEYKSETEARARDRG